MKRSEKKEFVQKLKDEIDTSSSVIVAHYSGLTVEDSDQLRSEMRSNGAKFKVTKNRLTKLALEQTQFSEIVDLFTSKSLSYNGINRSQVDRIIIILSNPDST